MRALRGNEVKSDGFSQVTWEIEPGDSCHLIVIHSDLRQGANEELYGAWPMNLSGLKTLLETPEKLTMPGELDGVLLAGQRQYHRRTRKGRAAVAKEGVSISCRSMKGGRCRGSAPRPRSAPAAR